MAVTGHAFDEKGICSREAYKLCFNWAVLAVVNGLGDALTRETLAPVANPSVTPITGDWRRQCDTQWLSMPSVWGG